MRSRPLDPFTYARRLKPSNFVLVGSDGNLFRLHRPSITRGPSTYRSSGDECLFYAELAVRGISQRHAIYHEQGIIVCQTFPFRLLTLSAQL